MGKVRTTRHRRRASFAGAVAMAVALAACGPDDATRAAGDGGVPTHDADHDADHLHDHVDEAPELPGGRLMAPEFELAALAGGTTRLSDYRDHPVAVVFMHTY